MATSSSERLGGFPAVGVHNCFDLVELFERCFAAEFNTRLVPGSEEPEYLPAHAAGGPAAIHFTRDYFASALHEVAHWCVAGNARRQMPDYGYWYAPDGRTLEQQQTFEKVEVKPQALEWIFAASAGYRFRVSADNLTQGVGASASFKQAIVAQARRYLTLGLPSRAARFQRALADYYGNNIGPADFTLEQLA